MDTRPCQEVTPQTDIISRQDLRNGEVKLFVGGKRVTIQFEESCVRLADALADYFFPTSDGSEGGLRRWQDRS